jgi:hypothetical protein
MSGSGHLDRATTLSFLCSRARPPCRNLRNGYRPCLPRQTGAAFAANWPLGSIDETRRKKPGKNHWPRPRASNTRQVMPFERDQEGEAR